MAILTFGFWKEEKVFFFLQLIFHIKKRKGENKSLQAEKLQFFLARAQPRQQTQPNQES